MKFIPSTLIALMAAAPVFSIEIASNLTIVVVTAWGEGVIAGHILFDLLPNRVRVDTGRYQMVESFGPFEKEILDVDFGVKRNVGDDHFYIVSYSSWSIQKAPHSVQCTASVIEDPKVPIVYVVIEGEGDDFTYKASGHEKEVPVECDKKFYNVKESL
jgi:hypothetical protein